MSRFRAPGGVVIKPKLTLLLLVYVCGKQYTEFVCYSDSAFYLNIFVVFPFLECQNWRTVVFRRKDRDRMRIIAISSCTDMWSGRNDYLWFVPFVGN